MSFYYDIGKSGLCYQIYKICQVKKMKDFERNY